MTTVYHIPRWNETFENAKSRGYAKCSYVCMPNKQDGLGLQRILAEKDGASIFGVWCLILQACSRQGKHRDGWLTDDGHPTGDPWRSDDLAFRWRRTSDEIQRALDFLCEPKVGWLRRINKTLPNSGSASPDADSKERKKEGRKERDSAESRQPEGEVNPPPPVPDSDGEGKASSQREALRGLLGRLAMSTNNADVDEWFGALKHEAKCKGWEEIQDFFSWAQPIAKRAGATIKHRRHAGTLPQEWDEHGREEFYAPMAAENT